MGDLTLPGLEPARPVPSAAGSIERAGEKVKGATDAISGLMYETELAHISTQTQEATLQVQKGMNDTLNVIKDNPYVTPEVAKGLFGGNVPPGVKLDEDVYVAGGKVVKQPRAVIPMHELVPYLFEDKSARVLENAAGNIKHEGWQAKFREHAKADIERTRSEAMDWQRGQRLADTEIRTVAQYEQAMAARSWDTAEAILDSPGMRVETREKLLAGYPERRTKAEVQDRIRGALTPEAVDGVIKLISENKVGEGGFIAPLSSEDQSRLTAVAHEQKNELLHEADRAKKAAYKANLERVGNIIEQARLRSEQTGLPPSAYYSFADFAKETDGLDSDDTRALLGMMTTSPSTRTREPDWAVYTDFAKARKDGKLTDMPVTEIYKQRAALGSKYDDVLGWWMAAKDPADPKNKPPFNEYENRNIGNVVHLWLKMEGDPKTPKERDEYGRAQAQIEDAMFAWRKAHPDEPMSEPVIRAEASRIFGKSVYDKGDAGADSALQAVLPSILGHAPIEAEKREHKQRIEEQGPLVDAAYTALIDPDEMALDSDLRARVYAATENKLVRGLLEEKLAKDGKPVNPRTVVFEAMSLLAPHTEGNDAYQRKQEAKATTVATERQVSAAADKIRSIDSAAAKAQTDAERARWNALPYWEQQAEIFQKEAFERAEYARERAVRAEVELEFGPRSTEVRPPGFDISTMSAVKQNPAVAEAGKRAAAGREERHAAFTAQMSDAKDAYRKFLERVDAKEPTAVKAWNDSSLGLHNFANWLKARREGKVL